MTLRRLMLLMVAICLPAHAADSQLPALARDGDAQGVDAALRSGASSDAPDRQGHAPLHLAAAGGHVDVVRRLLDAGANVNVKGPKGWTPLHAATFNQQAAVVRLLLERGADRSVVDANGLTALELARGAHDAALESVLSGPASAAARAPGRAVVTAASLAVRVGPSLSARTLGTVLRDETLEILDVTGDWRLARTAHGLEGWIASEFIRCSDGDCDHALAAADQASGGAETAVVGWAAIVAAVPAVAPAPSVPAVVACSVSALAGSWTCHQDLVSPPERRCPACSSHVDFDLVLAPNPATSSELIGGLTLEYASSIGSPFAIRSRLKLRSRAAVTCDPLTQTALLTLTEIQVVERSGASHDVDDWSSALSRPMSIVEDAPLIMVGPLGEIVAVTAARSSARND